MATIAIVIVNWNGWEMTLQCLAALKASRLDAFDWHAYLVDNASTDASIEHFADLGPNVTLVRSPINGGWTGGNNLGVEHALRGDHRFVLLLNNDAMLEANALCELMRAHAERVTERPILGCLQRKDDGEGLTFITVDIDPRTGLIVDPSAERKQALLKERFIPTPIVNGAALFAHRSVFEEMGPFDERFYLNFDEADWCLRAAARGHGLYTLRDSVIFHSGNKSIGGASSPLQTYFVFRNHLLFSEKHGTPMQRLRVARAVLARLRDVTGRESWWNTFRQLRSPSPVLEAMEAGLRDYVLRRFGDCPAAIRELSRREAQRLASS